MLSAACQPHPYISVPSSLELSRLPLSSGRGTDDATTLSAVISTSTDAPGRFRCGSKGTVELTAHEFKRCDRLSDRVGSSHGPSARLHCLDSGSSIHCFNEASEAQSESRRSGRRRGFGRLRKPRKPAKPLLFQEFSQRDCQQSTSARSPAFVAWAIIRSIHREAVGTA